MNVKCENVLSTVPGTVKAQGGGAVVIILLRETMPGFAGKEVHPYPRGLLGLRGDMRMTS